MPPSPATAIAAFSRRAAAGAFVAGAARAVLVVAGATAAGLLAARLAGRQIVPSPWWAVLALPVLAGAGWRARAERPDPATAATHLDRRLGLAGLLLCAHDGAILDAAQRSRLAAGLAALPGALPRIRWRALLPRPLVALAIGVALLPPPAAPAPSLPRAAAAAELARLAARLHELAARGELTPDAQQDLARSLQELQQQQATPAGPEWRDLDELDRRLEREALLQAAAAAAADTADTPSHAVSPAALAAAAEALAAAGLWADLPADVQAMLAAAQRGDGSLAPDALPQDAETQRRLAAAMAAAAQQPGALQRLAAAGGGQIAQLREVLDRFGGGAAGEAGGGPEPDGAATGAGRGGIDRGPGHAALAFTEDASGGADAALPLPPGQPVPTEWVPLASRRLAPEVAPVANPAAGGGAATGAGGATWQLELAPRHRAVVQRYFGGDATPADGKDKR
jgi:hypothetical protein